MAHLHQDIHRNRIKSKWIQHLKQRILGDHVLLQAEVATTKDPVPYAKKDGLDYRPIAEGDQWGETWESGWFRATAQVPADWAGAYVVARIDVEGEILVFRPDGSCWQGMCNGSVFDTEYAKDILHLLPEAKGGESIELTFEAAANHLFGVTTINDTEFMEDESKLHGHHRGQVKALRLHVFDHAHWQLWLDVKMLQELEENLGEDTPRKERLLRGLNKAADAYYREGLAAAQAIVSELMDLPADPGTIDIFGVGHAHIDTGWLWPVRETIRKSARTYASALDLIKRYPGYVFGASQPAHYQMMKEHYPELYDRIKQAHKDGSWELQGGMWVEADCNIISGESMVRQFVQGKHFFKREFGEEVRNLWLPDVFGYSANLPQILAKSGCPAFLTQKLSWSAYNLFPHHTFNWRGIDGSEVLAHFLPEDNYNATCRPWMLKKAERSYKDRGIHNECMSLFGIGDGGGGPKEEHIEWAQRAANCNGLPRYHMSKAQPVLDRMLDQKEIFETWQGELYLELHRATLTTQGQTKRLMRRAEEALRAAEMICAAAGLDSYPQAEFDELWQCTLLNQFHDIIPGSSIHWVYEVTEAELQGVIDRCAELAEAAAASLLQDSDEAITCFNPSSTAYDDVVALPAGWSGAMVDGNPLHVQVEGDQRLVRVMVPPQDFCTLHKADALPAAAVERDELVLENELVRYEFDANLQVVRGYDKVNKREILKAAGNVISLYEDRPTNWDAWDIDEYYMNCGVGTATATGPVEQIGGALRQGLAASLSVGKAAISQRVFLRPGSARLDFETTVDWDELHRMLRVAFPTTVTSDLASFEVQYGVVQRPTHTNTTWDLAKFEVVGHRFADVSMPDWGVAVLNDSKYGWCVRDGVIDLNLLRAPTHPDPVADKGQHVITYSLLPHAGDLVRADAVRSEAAMINQGLSILPGAAAGISLPVSVAGPGIEFAVLKKAEEEDAYIVRVNETRGIHTQGSLTAAAGASIVPTNLVEWDDDETAATTGSMALELGPFEIATFKVRI